MIRDSAFALDAGDVNYQRCVVLLNEMSEFDSKLQGWNSSRFSANAPNAIENPRAIDIAPDFVRDSLDSCDLVRCCRLSKW